jgi:outer membrane protein TolC
MALAAIAVVCAGAASCSRYEFANPPPYIGPVHAPAAGQVPAEGQAAAPGEGPSTSLRTGQPAAPPTAPPTVPPTGPVAVTVTDSVLMALANNQALVVQRYATPIKRTAEQTQWAAFDPDLTATAEYGRTKSLKALGSPFSSSQTGSLDVGLSQFFPTGTTVSLDGSVQGVGPGNEFYTTRLGLSVTQAILRGYGPDVNLANVREARVDTLSTEYQLRGFAESLVATVEETYWNYVLAQRNIEIFNQSLKLAEQQLSETNERIKVGKLAEIERAAAEAEVALRREALINARSTLDKTRLQFLRLLNPAAPDFWTRDVAAQTLPVVPEVKLEDVASHVQVALRMRPDLNQARLQVQRGDLEIVKTRNGLLPQLDLFATLGKSGYSGTFGRSVEHMDEDAYDLLVGVTFEYPPINRSAKAADQRARLTRHQSYEAVGNLAQLVQVDVRSAYLEVTRSKEQMAATAVTRKLQEEKVRAETEKFRVGKSTTLLVAQAQRDLLQSQIDEVQAVVSYLNAMVEFYRLEGSLLQRRGIAAPGQDPVELPPERLP